ncbi:bifunctional sugar phosphate isomerase/epimerase/4-hydroxyphenylpyruvate dioxygenase family protein [Kocuria sp. TGY1127_2]|uniref:bifunctional sugar phosphate isomerase/epimerase/4-hydroxyphenylpyruvate dioxygenase family protein n=1 Tax=Kocuria sp. TGY1127_2 TaxID=2711328 RepID=UPI0015B833C6|nr:sugar phosphate isomerase/epimerase and 4-hydroxyphenylpyruvate domain-containing protein [Kocuria sp. TGY1127_2]
MKTSIATVCLSGSLRQKMRAAAAAGFDGIEIFEQDLVVAPETPEYIREYAAELGLTLDLYQPFRDAEGTTEEMFQGTLRRIEGKFRLMRRLGMNLMLIPSNAGTATVDDDSITASQLARLADLAATYDIRLAYEALAWGRYVNDFEHSWRLVEAADRENLGICLDTFHILSREWPTDSIPDIPGEKVFFVQLADAPLMSLDVLSWSRHFRVFPGEGGFDLVDFMIKLLAGGYSGPLSLEIFNDSFRQTRVYRTAVDALRSLVWLQDQTARALDASTGSNAAITRAAARVGELTTLPGAIVPQGITWAEVRGQETEQVEVLLSHLGFTHRGRHSSKPVQLWEQGHARIVINEEPSAMDVPNMASLGFEVQHDAAAAAHASALKVPEVPRVTREGEQPFPAYLAPDGTEIFFCPPQSDGGDRWLNEFSWPDRLDVAASHRKNSTEDATTPLITGIDHVNLAQPKHHYPESVLFYRAALGLAVQPSQDVPGPTGLVSSQVVRNDAGTVRLPLNVAPDLGNEPEIEHVAFACSDVVELARRAQSSGLRFLPIPQNYYEDLRARFGLSEEKTQELAALNLLYDRDGQGEFLHFYTQTVGSLFFEVVQRLEGYSGYGAPNAPVRMASQYTHSLLSR